MSKNKRSEEDIDGTDKDGAIFVVHRPKSLKTTQNNQKETEGGQGYIGQDLQEGVIKNKQAHSQKLIEMATSYYKSGNFLKAIECYEEVIDGGIRNSLAIDLYTKLALCYQEAGNFLKVIECYEEVAFCHQRLGNIPKAIEQFEKAIKLGSKNPIIFSNLSSCYHKSGNLPKAIEQLAKAIQLGIKDISIFSGLGFYYKQLGNLPKAIEYYEHAAQLGYPSYIEIIGGCYQQLGNLPKAIKYYEHAIHGTNDRTIFSSLGFCYQQLGNLPKAAEFYIRFLQLLKLQPHLCKIVFDCLRQISFDFETVKHVTGVIIKAIELNMAFIKLDLKKDVICNFNIAEGYLLYSTFDKSKEKLLLEKAATHYYKSGSKEALEKILAISEDRVLISKAYYELGNLAFSENNYQKAVALYKKSLESQDKAKVIVGVYTQLALAYDKILGKEKEKIEASKEATKYLPTLYEEISESTALPSVLCDIILSSYVGIDQYSEQHKNNQKLEQLLGDSEDITEVL